MGIFRPRSPPTSAYVIYEWSLSNYGPATAGTTNDGQSRANQGNGNVATGMNSKNVPIF